MSLVGAPGVKTSATPRPLSSSASSSGIVPPTTTSTSSALVLAQAVQDARHEGHVRAGEDRDADGVRVLLDRGLDDLLRGLVKAGVDDLHTRVAKGAGDDLGPAVMPVQTGLGDDHANLPATLRVYGGASHRRGLLARLAEPRRGAVRLPRRGRRGGCCSTAARVCWLACASKEGWPEVDAIVDHALPPGPLGDLVPWVWGRCSARAGERGSPSSGFHPGAPRSSRTWAALRRPGMFERTFEITSTPRTSRSGLRASRSCRCGFPTTPCARTACGLERPRTLAYSGDSRPATPGAARAWGRPLRLRGHPGARGARRRAAGAPVGRRGGRGLRGLRRPPAAPHAPTERAARRRRAGARVGRARARGRRRELARATRPGARAPRLARRRGCGAS